MSPVNTPPAILKYSKGQQWQFIPTSGPVLFPADFNFFPPILISALGKSGFGPVVIARWFNAITRRRSVCLGDLPSAEGGGSTSGASQCNARSIATRLVPEPELRRAA